MPKNEMVIKQFRIEKSRAIKPQSRGPNKGKRNSTSKLPKKVQMFEEYLMLTDYKLFKP